ncbi:ABC transporter ATP-binding protein [Bacillus testis]|uniref:ABC transporter ATP-binding protein n=1 Tax=Bacillus testis TaxID=1622072 RepID=UPI00067F6738|nr:ABC transporter ATP-binding protein [Bacillus testis]
MITFKHVTKSYEDGTKAVDSLNFTIEKGEFFVLIGPSGCGKTTTLKMVNRLIERTSGEITLNGKDIQDYDIHELRWDIGYVLQQISLFPHMTIGENIAVVPELKKWDKNKVNKRVEELLVMVGLDPDRYRHKKPSELSGGEQQRIGVARALAADPALILMDEPFSALDPISREKLQEDMLHLKRAIHKTIIFVTHDIQEALKLGDRICVMKEGAIEQIGTPHDILHAPVNSFVSGFIGVHRGLPKEPAIAEYMERGPILAEEAASLNKIPVDADFSEALNLLLNHESIAIVDAGAIIGTLSRKDVIRLLANQQSGGGAVRG